MCLAPLVPFALDHPARGAPPRIAGVIIIAAFMFEYVLESLVPITGKTVSTGGDKIFVSLLLLMCMDLRNCCVEVRYCHVDLVYLLNYLLKD